MREKFESLRSPPGTQLGAQGQPECMHCCICPPSLPSSCDLGFMTAGCLPSVLAPSPFMPTGVASCVALGVSSDLADAAAAKSRGHGWRQRKPPFAAARPIFRKRTFASWCSVLTGPPLYTRCGWNGVSAPASQSHGVSADADRAAAMAGLSRYGDDAGGAGWYHAFVRHIDWQPLVELLGPRFLMWHVAVAMLARRE